MPITIKSSHDILIAKHVARNVKLISFISVFSADSSQVECHSGLEGKEEGKNLEGTGIYRFGQRDGCGKVLHKGVDEPRGRAVQGQDADALPLILPPLC
jgi:hypothetical protein